MRSTHTVVRFNVEGLLNLGLAYADLPTGERAQNLARALAQLE